MARHRTSHGFDMVQASDHGTICRASGVIDLHFPETWSDRRDPSLDVMGLKSYVDDLQRLVGPYLNVCFGNSSCRVRSTHMRPHRVVYRPTKGDQTGTYECFRVHQSCNGNTNARNDGESSQCQVARHQGHPPQQYTVLRVII